MLDKVATDGVDALAMDVREEADIVTKIGKAVSDRGPIQFCVPNAGTAEGKSILKMDLDFWRNMLAANLDGAFLTIRESLRSMTTTDRARVIPIAAFAGLRGLPARRATRPLNTA